MCADECRLRSSRVGSVVAVARDDGSGLSSPPRPPDLALRQLVEPRGARRTEARRTACRRPASEQA
eukprot:scaffold16011_cov33-Phaeocystis_antarctica.AAC.2